jgi:Tfp pilus assembly protein PilF
VIPRKVLFCLIAFGFLAASSARAQRTSQSATPRFSSLQIDVQIRFPNGEAGPAGIHIVLERGEGGTDSDCQTVQGGKCTLTASDTGIFIVRLRQQGYQEVSERVELIHTDHGYVMLTLYPLSRADGSTPAENAPSGEISVTDYSIPEKAREEYGKGEAALREKKPEDGVKHFQKAVKIYDNYPRAYRMLGESYLELKDWKKSEDALKKSISLDPKLAAAYVDLGAVYNQEKNYTQAEETLKKGLELSPDAVGAKYELAKTYWALNRWQDAAPLAKATVTDLPDLAPAHVLYGNILLKQRDGAGALHEYKEYLRLEPGGAMATAVREQVEKLEKALGK